MVDGFGGAPDESGGRIAATRAEARACHNGKESWRSYGNDNNDDDGGGGDDDDADGGDDDDEDWSAKARRRCPRLDDHADHAIRTTRRP